MKYEKPAIHSVGSAEVLVLGTKGLPNVQDSSPQHIQSSGAYEADE
jgi:hypothetical protein